MIPIRVYVKGFLSHQHESELMFDGAPLWVLAGHNGAGKSAIFDAITFTLYGLHRGGKSNLKELINHQADEADVEFDFRLGDKTYRVKRTVAKKKRSTFQAFQLLKDKWKTIAETDKEEGFNKWVEEHIGLNDKTFTASVLLRQGESEALLTADAPERHRMLTQIVNLSAYEKLCEKVESYRKTFDSQVKLCQTQLSRLEVVDDAQIKTLAKQAKEAKAQAEAAQKELEQLILLKEQAGRWSELGDEKSELETALQKSVKAVLQINARAVSSLAFETLREAIAASKSVPEKIFSQLEDEVEQKRREADGLKDLQNAIAWLKQFDSARVAWHRAKETKQEMEQLSAMVEKQLASIEKEKSEYAKNAKEAAANFEKMQARFEKAKTLLEQAKQQDLRFSQVDGKSNCLYCGQSLKAEHLKAERARLQNELREAKRVEQEAKHQHKEAVHVCNETSEQLEEISEREREFKQKAKDATRDIQQAERELAKAEEQATAALQALPADYRKRIVPTSTAKIAACFAAEFPSNNDFKEFVERVKQEPVLRQQVSQLTVVVKSLSEQRANKSKIEQIDKQLMKIPVDARVPIEKLNRQEREIHSRKQKADAGQKRAEGEKRELESVRKRRRELENELQEATTQAHLHKELARYLGRDYLQRYLLNQAETAIVANANRLLDHISGGILRVQLRKDDISTLPKSGVKALDLVAYNKQTGNAPESVAFLSGSQKFRVAISLALGIGQYASNSSRRIESVIIDEGFGGLDKEGRSKMIDELQTLRSVLQRIILVSHQEEFTDAFPNRYTITLENGSSRVSLFDQE